RITNPKMREWKNIQGIPIDKNANPPANRTNFFFVQPGMEKEVIKRQWKNYFINPSKYGLSDTNTIEQMIKKFDQQNPQNKIHILRNDGVDLGVTLGQTRTNLLNLQPTTKTNIPTVKTPAPKEIKTSKADKAMLVQDLFSQASRGNGT